MTAEASSEDALATLLIQFARLPRPGAVKTRLIPTLAPAEACAVHEALLEWSCRQLLAAEIGPVELWLDRPGAHAVVDRCQRAGVDSLRIQCPGDLGQRMFAALNDGLQRYRQVLLVGSDCPQLDADYLQQASRALAAHDCVLGPAQDGGYVLIGARRISRACFEGVAWGTEQVRAQTLQRMAGSGLSCRELAPRRDIDRPEDLALWRELSGGLRR